MSSPTTPLRIAVVGGGIAGVSLVRALLKKKDDDRLPLDVTLYEQMSYLKEIGAGVALGPNAAASLRAMGLGDAFDAVAGEPTKDVDTWLEWRVGEAGPDSQRHFATVKGPSAALGDVSRAQFLDELARSIPPEAIKFSYRASGYTQTPSGVTLHFEKTREGKEVDDVGCDVLIAADGIKSNLRARLYANKGEVPVIEYSDWVAWRGLFPTSEYEEIFGKDTSTKLMHCGEGRHILTFPVRAGTLINVVGFVRDEDHRKLGDNTGPWSEQRPKQEMLDDFKTFSPECLKMLEAIENPSIWGIFWLPPIKTAIDDRVALLGDSGAATTPHQGSGAGQAIEGAHLLSNLLTHTSLLSAPSPSDRITAINRALAVYESSHQPRAQKVQTTSFDAGLLYEFLGPDGRDLEKIKADLEGVEEEGQEGRMEWIWKGGPAVDGELERLLSMLSTA